MKTKLNITGGEWEVEESDGTVRSFSALKTSDQMGDYRGAIICDMKAGLGMEFHGLGRKHAINETKANAELIAQAGTVANRTGLMPEDLEKQRDELVGILEDVINSAKPHPIENPTMFETWQSIKRILAEIKTS